MLYHEKENLAYFTYPELPIFNLTTSQKDIATRGTLSLYTSHFDIPSPKHCNHLHLDRVVQVDSIYDPIKEGDALVTNKKGVPLMICHADCQAAIFYDPKTESLGLAHSGWRGSNLNIYGKVIKTMQDRFGTDPSDLIVVVSPSLGPDHSEFINYEKELNPDFIKYQFKPTYFDFWAIARDQLKEAGVQNINISGFCTFANPKRCFSYRRDKTRARDATIAML